MKRSRSLAALATAALAPATIAQLSDISPDDKHSWGENIGYMNWRDAGDPAASQGARLNPTCMSGLVWCENVGWINLGDGSPADGENYSNDTGTDFGVNYDPNDHLLTGMAWGENIGWINFKGGAGASPSNPARFDPVDWRLRGFAWSPNVGWINLDDDVVFVALKCPSDYNGDGFVDGIDSDQFNNDFEAGNPAADYNRDGFIDGIDADQFNNDFEAGC